MHILSQKAKTKTQDVGKKDGLLKCKIIYESMKSLSKDKAKQFDRDNLVPEKQICPGYYMGSL